MATKTRAQRLARALQASTDLTYQRALRWVESHHERTGHKFADEAELLATYQADQTATEQNPQLS